jgi:hypothetical protein
MVSWRWFATWLQFIQLLLHQRAVKEIPPVWQHEATTNGTTWPADEGFKLASID